MPIVASPTQQAWIRVPPPRRKFNRTHANNAIKGPLAYFSCQPVPPKPPSKIPLCPQYDIDDLDLLPQKKRNGDGSGGKGKDRTVSAPATPGNARSRGGQRHDHDHSHDHDAEEDAYSGEEDHYDEPFDSRSHTPSHRERRSPPSLERSREHHSHRPPPTNKPTTTSPENKHSQLLDRSHENTALLHIKLHR